MTKHYTKASILMVFFGFVRFMLFVSALQGEEGKERDMQAWDFGKVPLGQIPEGPSSSSCPSWSS
jgi:hypothetical protein